ncbi:MAG: LamG domain-containing protein [Candidatus Zixiibacteriota bacterium]
MTTLEKGLLTGLAAALVAGSASWVWADTINWPFSVAGDYTVSDATKVEVAGGVAKLIAIDQTDNDNTSTGFGGGTHSQTQWDGTNGWLELTTTGQTNGSGDFISRVMDVGATAAWNSISWTPQRPLYKELPANKGTETAYPTGNADMTGNVLLMHMNEASGTIVDTSGQANNGTGYNGVTYGATGKFNTALSFDSIDDYVEIPDDLSLRLTTGGTIEAWIYPLSHGENGYGRIVDKSINSVGGGSGYEFDVEGTNNLGLNVDGQALDLHTTTGVLTLNAWNHVAATFDGTYWKLYSNGVEVGSKNSTVLPPNTAATVRIGNRADNTDRTFDGAIDEVAIYNSALSPTEILDHYKRGALRLKYQVRSGSANPPTGSFIGPDGTTGTYYSELSNSATGLPSLSLTNVADNQYFQYKAYLETDNSSYSPELTSVTIGPAHYPGDNPTVQNSTGQTYAVLSSFAETLGAGNAGSVKYQISNDGTNWYYWNGVNWAAASGYSQTNTAAEVNANCGQFDNDVGTGSFYFKAFLHSDAAAQQVELDSVDLVYTPLVISVSVSNSTFAFGTNLLNTWLTPQTSVITNDGTVAENFVARISQFSDGSNTWGIAVTANGPDTIRAQWSTTSATGPWADISAYDTDFTIATNVAVNDSVTLWFHIETSTSTSSYNQYSSTLTVTAQEF